jgi:uncharacterized membrane protein
MAPVALVGNGLIAGDMFCTAVGLVPLMLSLPYGGYVRMVQFLWPRYDPTMPALNVTTCLLGACLAVLVGPAPARLLFGAAAVLIGSVIALSVRKAVPLNRYVAGLDPEAQPGDWAARDPRKRWHDVHLVRTALAVTALAANAVATTLA